LTFFDVFSTAIGKHGYDAATDRRRDSGGMVRKRLCRPDEVCPFLEKQLSGFLPLDWGRGDFFRGRRRGTFAAEV
jgi:hypothetical protein